jgi:hypothetical protein
MDPLVSYLVTAMKTWSPEHLMPHKDVSHYQSIAEDFKAVATDPAEKSLFEGADGRAKTALLFASIAFMESSYWPSIDDGTCNGLHPEKTEELDLLKKAGMGCDGKNAWSIMQIHVGKGIWLTVDGFTSMGGTGPAITGPDLIKDRRLAIRVALHILRSSLRANIGLCGYSGEHYREVGDDHNCPLAHARMQRAKDYFKEHPYAP